GDDRRAGEGGTRTGEGEGDQVGAGDRAAPNRPPDGTAHQGPVHTGHGACEDRPDTRCGGQHDGPCTRSRGVEAYARQLLELVTRSDAAQRTDEGSETEGETV